MILVRALGKGIRRAASRGAGHLLAAMGSSQALLLLLGVVLARFLGPDQFGHVRVIGAVLKLAAIPAALGLPAAIAKYVSELPAWEGGKKIFSLGTRFSLFSSLAVALLIFAALLFSNPLGDETARRYLLLLCWTIPLAVFSSGAVSLFQGRREIRRMAAYQVLLAAIRFACVGGLTLAFLLPGYAGGIAAAEAAGALLLYLATRPSLRCPRDGAATRKMLRLGVFTSLGLTFATLNLTLDTLCLSAILSDPGLVGQYGAAATLALGLMLIPGALEQTFFPYLSRQFRNPALLKMYFFHLLQMVALVMLVVCGAVFLFASPLIRAVFGPGYGSAPAALRVLLPGIFCYSLQKISGIILFARGRTDLNFYVTLIGGGLNVLLNVILIRRYGLIGAAWATTLTFALRMAVSFLFFFRQLGSPLPAGPGDGGVAPPGEQ